MRKGKLDPGMPARMPESTYQEMKRYMEQTREREERAKMNEDRWWKACLEGKADLFTPDSGTMQNPRRGILGDQEMVEDGSMDYYAGTEGLDARELTEKEKALEAWQLANFRKINEDLEKMKEGWREEKK
jgi:predicted transcriptional regulator YdeE